MDTRPQRAGRSPAALLWSINFGLLMVLIPLLLYYAQRMAYRTPLSYNEGWNAYVVSRLLHGGRLYPPLTGGLPVTPVNYPPLAFLLVAGLTRLSDHLVLNGRYLAFTAFLCTAIAVFAVVQGLQPNRAGAAMSALLWLALVALVTGGYVGMYDPQMVGQAFSTAALALYVRWRDRPVPWRIGTLALLCCAALCIKPLFIAVPATIAAACLPRDRRSFWLFAAALTGVGLVMLLGSRVRFGPNLWPNLLVNRYHLWEPARIYAAALVTLARLSLLAAFLPVFLLKIRKAQPLPLIYFAVSALAAAYLFSVHGSAQNSLFDFFLATAVGWGMFAGQLAAPKPAYAPWFVGGLLVTSLASFVFATLPRDVARMNYSALHRDEQVYQEEVARLRSIPGPALFENPLIGFDAGKELEFDPFWGTELIATGHLPERVLTDRIKAKWFSVIALSFDLGKAVPQIEMSEINGLQSTRMLAGRWTAPTLLAISENYRLLGRWYGYIYVPRK